MRGVSKKAWVVATCLAVIFTALAGSTDAQSRSKRKKPGIKVQSRYQQKKAQERAKLKKKSSSKSKDEPKNKNLPSIERGKVDIEVAEVDAGAITTVMRSAARIDQLVEAKLAKEGLKPNAMSSNEQFVRRAYLSITGTIPTAREASSFLRTGGNAEKRQRLIDRLLNSPGHASHMYNYWADVFRVVDRVNNNNYIRPYGEWIKQCLRENEPWDKMVRSMLTAEGKVWEDPASGYLLRDAGMPLDNLNNTVRIFLGTRIGCAQCHDHPFDKWTQKEFYQLAALTSGTDTQIVRQRAPRGKKNESNTYNDLNKALNKMANGGSQAARRARNILRLNRSGLWENLNRQLKYPHDYAYDNAKPNQVVKPGVIFGSLPAVKPGESRREAFADWLASPDNPRFTLTVANRLWKHAMGYGVIEPVDDMMDDTEPSNPELMEFLVSEMERLNYNMKEFQRIIYNTKTWQREATYTNLDPEKPYHFPGPVLRRMTAEQVWDSLLTLTVPNPNAYLRPSDEEYVDIVDIDLDTTPDQMLAKVGQLNEYNKRQSQIRRERSYKNYRDVGGQIELARASELQQPLRADHFLRQFGQSDRQIISDSTTDGTVPQLLTMFNGPVTHMMMEEGSVIYEAVAREKNDDARIRAIFMSLLGRGPSDDDEYYARQEVRRNKNAGYGNIIWALLNTREFLFIQ